MGVNEEADKVLNNLNSTLLGIQQGLEQYEGFLKGIAPLMGTYYSALIDSGIPPELADSMTMQFHEMFWCKMNDQEYNG